MDKDEIKNEVVEIGGKTLLSLIPVLGTIATLIWDSIKTHTGEKRLEKWKNEVGDRLSKVEKTVNELGENEVFSSAMIKATELALRTAEDDKRKYLANAVYNSIDTDISENKLMIFLNLLEDYTVWHVQVLNYFHDPVMAGAKSDGYMTGAPITPMKEILPKICEDSEMVRKIIRDLQSDGVMQQGDFISTTMTARGMIEKRTTKLGDEFLNFITCDDED